MGTKNGNFGTLFNRGLIVSLWLLFLVETPQFGHILVALPFVFDQPLNARLLVEIDRGEVGSYDKNDKAKSLRLAMVSGKRRTEGSCKEAPNVIGDQEKYNGQFVEYLKNGVVNNGIHL